MQKPPRIITIVARDDGKGDFDIHEGENVVAHLAWDEMLGSIAVITHPQLGASRPNVPPYRMQHIDEAMASRYFFDVHDKSDDDSMFREVGE